MTDTLIAPPSVPAETLVAAVAPADPVAPAGPVAPADAVALADPVAPMGRKRRLVRFGVLGLVVGGLAVSAAVLPLHDIAEAVLALGRTGAAVTLAVIGGLLLSVMVPRTAITIACGAMLGATAGAAAALGAAVIAAVATYYAGRWAGSGALRARAGSRLARLDGWLDRRGLSAVLLVRFLPLAPFGLVGYAYGTTSVCRKRYLLGTTIAAIPSAVSYAVIGAAVADPHRMSPLTLAPAAVGFALTTAIVWRWKRSTRRAQTAA